MANPKITVLMSVYNGEKYLEESIDCILNQTFKDFEFLIVNDGSTDKTAEILQRYHDPRIKIINNDRNIGLTKSLNKGLRIAKGEYIARQDADDISDPKRLGVQTQFLDRHPYVGVLGINAYVIDERGSIVGKMERPISHSKIVAKILGENQMVHSSLMLRKALLETYGYYDENLILAQDYELILRLSSVTGLANLADHHLHSWRKDTSLDISVAKRQAQIAFRDRIRKDFLERHYALNRKYANLVLGNFLNNPTDIILSEYFNKVLEDASLICRLFLKLRQSLYFLRKSGFHPRVLLMYHKKKITEAAKDKYIGLRKVIARKHRNHPYSLIFLMKNTCNARCIMCGLKYMRNSNASEITLEDYKTMLNNLVMGKVTEITFSGGGEPLLCKDIMEIVDYTKEIYAEVALNLHTNGVLLSEKFAQKFIKQDFRRIVISINASTPETYYRVVRINSFNRVVSNIRNLVSLRNNLRANTRIELSFVASLLNIDDLPGLIALGSELGVDEVSMLYCRFYSRKISLDSNDFDTTMDNKNYSLFFHKAHSDEVVKEAFRMAKLKRIYFRHEHLFSSSQQPKQQCTWPWTTILIGPRGEIYPCGGGEVMFYKAVRDNRLYFGNLLEKHISRFWNNEDYRRLRRSCDYRNKNKSIPQCWNCNHTMRWEGPNSKRSHFIDVDI